MIGNKVWNLHIFQLYLCNYRVKYFILLLFRHQQQMMLTSSLSPFRYTYSMLSVIGLSYAVLTWLSQTLWMPIYPLCVLAEGKKRVTCSVAYWQKPSSYNSSLNILVVKLLFWVPHSWLNVSFLSYFPRCKEAKCEEEKLEGEAALLGRQSIGWAMRSWVSKSVYSPRRGLTLTDSAIIFPQFEKNYFKL